MPRSSILRTAATQLKARAEKACEVCGKPFSPRSSFQRVCGKRCALRVVKKDLAARKEAVKSRSDWLNEAQAEVNKLVRLRDADLPCISCGRHHKGQYHAGHYLSRGANPALRFNLLNIAKQCQPCNVHLSGNQINFRKGLIERIGLEKIEWLEGPHDPEKWTIDEIKAIRDDARRQIKEMTK